MTFRLPARSARPKTTSDPLRTLVPAGVTGGGRQAVDHGSGEDHRAQDDQVVDLLLQAPETPLAGVASMFSLTRRGLPRAEVRQVKVK